MSTSTYSDAVAPDTYDSHHIDPRSLPVHYVDDRRYFRGYALPAMNVEQLAVVHRRIVADTNNEYNASIFAHRRAKVIAAVYGLVMLALTAVGVIIALLK